MRTSPRRRLVILRWLRNLLIVGSAVCIGLGLLAMLELRQHAAVAIPTPVGMGEPPADPAAVPSFGEEIASAMPYNDCVACHWDKLVQGTALAAATDDRSLQAQVARILQNRAAGETGAATPDGGSPDALPTLPPLPQPHATTTAGPAPEPTATPISGVPVRLTIPSLNLDSAVARVGATAKNGQTVWEVPRDVVGWYEATAPAGGKGNTVMSGHVAQREGVAVFRDLHQIHPGDAVYVDTAAGRVAYAVREVRIVLPTETSYLQPTPDATLTLITCAGHYDPATRSFSYRLIVIAKPEELDKPKG